ncbi:MAG TPA: recombinase family protein [Noviherbaspirillum sp.]|nr:recombinase family protein [Noviherbaspirillum sp.]
MTVFVYSHDGGATESRNDNLPSALGADSAAIRYVADDDDSRHGDGPRPRFRALINAINSHDTLIVNRLDDLGNNAQEISTTISLLLKCSARLFVRQIGDVDLASTSGHFVLNTVEALAGLERRPQPRAPGKDTVVRTARRSVEVPWRLRSAIVTDYSLGESISSLARRYKLPRTTIMKMVCPETPDEPAFPLAFGD